MFAIPAKLLYIVRRDSLLRRCRRLLARPAGLVYVWLEGVENQAGLFRGNSLGNA
jgi:hypothetical protein